MAIAANRRVPTHAGPLRVDALPALIPTYAWQRHSAGVGAHGPRLYSWAWFRLLAEDDVMNLAAAMDPGSTAGVLIWENLWAAPFASAARRSGGQLIANGRIPIQAIIASIEADEATETVGG